MNIAKRIFLFISVNVLVVVTISSLLSILGVRPYLTEQGLDLPVLAAFCLIWGMTGSLISLSLSRAIAKWAYGVRLIDTKNCDERQRRLVETIGRLTRSAGLTAMPEVGVYESAEPNAFATGPTQSRALVAVSTGLLDLMDDKEIEGVLGHEISHIANGDMVTMTLLQGVVNAFAMFLSRVVAYAVSSAMRSRDSRWVYYLVQFLLEWILLILGAIVVASYSRLRETRADDGGARLSGKENMIKALQALQRNYEKMDKAHAQPAVEALKISPHPQGIWKLFSTHPPLTERIARLESGKTK